MAAETIAQKIDPTGRMLAWYLYLEQDAVWKPNQRPLVQIADMDQAWRYNAARWLERRAATLSGMYSLGEHLRLTQPIGREVLASDADGSNVIYGRMLTAADLMSERVIDDMCRWDEERMADPVAWLRTTPLHRALVRGVPMDSAELARRAKHWSGCPARGDAGDCRCEEIRAAHDADGDAAQVTG